MLIQSYCFVDPSTHIWLLLVLELNCNFDSFILRTYHTLGFLLAIQNSYMILHDPAIYPDPHEFKPERFLTPDGTQINPDVLDPSEACFGFGRR